MTVVAAIAVMVVSSQLTGDARFDGAASLGIGLLLMVVAILLARESRRPPIGVQVDHLAPTPIGAPVELRARVREVRGRKRVVECTLSSGGTLRARAQVVAVEVPPTW